MSDVAKVYLDQITEDFKKVKESGEKAYQQLDVMGLNFKASPNSNSVAVIIRHIAGNMRSRFTDFLTSDGEKPYRHRDLEFQSGRFGREELDFAWEDGWKITLDAIAGLKPEDLTKTVTIRKEPHTVVKALQRQLAHYAYHVGQIVQLARIYQGDDWVTLSIPLGKSNEFNEKYSKEFEK